MKSSIYFTTVFTSAALVACFGSSSAKDDSGADNVSAIPSGTSSTTSQAGTGSAPTDGVNPVASGGPSAPGTPPAGVPTVSAGQTPPENAMSGTANPTGTPSVGVSPTDTSAATDPTQLPVGSATGTGSATSTATGTTPSNGTGGAVDAAGGAGGAVPSEPATGGAGPIMADAGPPVDKFIGNLAPKNQDIPADFADHWMQITMEANSKWGFVQPNSPDEWVWEPVDEAYQYAKDHDLVFKEHCFFWNFEQPSWVTNENITTVGPAWIKAFCERYPDIAMIDVVNEFLHNKSPYREGMGGAGETGHDWVIQAYRWAREFCPNSILILNDFNIIEYDNDHESFVEALDSMLAAGAPIDAIGAQGHDVYKVGAEVAKGYIDNLTEHFNLPIYITEVDVDLADDAEQLASMQEEITMFWDHPNVHGITYWGFLRGKTWRTNAWLIDTDGTERPAMTWLKQFIADHR